METILVFKVSALSLQLILLCGWFHLQQLIMITKWTIDSNQSDLLIKMKHATIAYLGGDTNHFNGFVFLNDDQIEDASLEFYLDSNTITSQKNILLPNVLNNKILEKKPFIRFKSTSFQKIRKNINFLKGYLTIKDITKMVEFDTEFIGIKNYNGFRTAAFEIKGDINRNDFSLDKNFNNSKEKFAFGKSFKLVANLEFSI